MPLHQLHERTRTHRRVRHHQASHEREPRSPHIRPIASVGGFIKRENIDPYPCRIGFLHEILVYLRRLVDHLYERVDSAFVTVCRKAEAIGCFRCIELRDQTLVVRSGHQDVHIVVPWYETAVTHSAKAAAVCEKVRKALLSANAIDFIHDFELDALHVIGGDSLHPRPSVKPKHAHRWRRCQNREQGARGSFSAPRGVFPYTSDRTTSQDTF